MAIVNKPSKHFETKLYTGNGTSQSISGLDFAPDFVWLKGKSVDWNHRLVNSIIGATKFLESNDNIAETTDATQISSFTSDGFSVGSGGATNQNGTTYASWNFKAGGTAVSNTDGSITSSVSANTTAGFSIVSYTGTGATATVGHGLGVAPKMIIGKGLENTINWTVGGSNISSNWTSSLALNATAAVNVANYWQDQAPNTNTFALTSDIGVNASGLDFIAYCFAEVKGFSKFGSYTGNGSTDGTFVYTGFKPAFVMIKRTDSTSSWNIWDNKRIGFNINNWQLEANTSVVENVSLQRMLLCSNGFKCITDNAQINASGGTYIYMAFAENPFVTSTANGSIPATAR
jgi:hypothetical protein